MKIFSGQLTKNFLNGHAVFVLPTDGEGAAHALKRLGGFDFDVDDSWSIAEVVRHGIFIEEGSVTVAEGGATSGNDVYYATVAQLVPGYEDPLTKGFNAIAAKQAEIEKRLAALEEKAAGRVIKTAFILDSPGGAS